MRYLLTTCVTVASAAIVGCGSSDVAPGGGKALDMGGPDANLVSALIEDVNDTGTNSKRLDAVFVKGSKPSDGKKFAQHSYAIVGLPKVDGATATATVRVTNSSSGTATGEVEWMFAKEGEKWKIKSAPLP